MSNDIEKFDPSKLMNGVRDRIKATFVSLIPDAQWEQLCTAEIDEFFKRKTKRNNYDNEMSCFQVVCSEVLKEISKEKLKEALEKYQGNVWEGYEVKLTEALKAELIKNASEIFIGMIGNRMQTIINEMKNRGY